MISAGPFPLMALVVVLAAGVALFVARRLARRTEGGGKAAAAITLDALLLGLLGARVGYALLHVPLYRADPVSLVRLGDGGFSVFTGVVAMAAYVLWRTRTITPLRRPVLSALLCGLLCWFAGSQALLLLQRSRVPLPDAVLVDMHGTPVVLAQFNGRPLVVNLWATWCGPCRREMPVLVGAQKSHPEITFVFANQGEAAAEIEAYMRAEGLQPGHVLLDTHSDFMRQTGARALPTTLFYDAAGRLRDVHMGELNPAVLEARLQRLR
ncbi:TlpA disulfide reductase family protein [Stenotrophomonas sp. YIM B06876]|uniref:TlpA disulfide reductase family protein n=1 Tax=Stenotrophomonas sp. YIM B06876 TaxID=3060211 RepID=UPI002739A7C1|nr:TlpA disulfide reductase family protein [Stenotrophomonas sp. YIM B06876]